MKHPVPDRVKPSIVIFDIWAHWRSGLSASVPRCQKLQLTRSGAGCFIAVSIITGRQTVKIPTYLSKPEYVRHVYMVDLWLSRGSISRRYGFMDSEVKVGCVVNNRTRLLLLTHGLWALTDAACRRDTWFIRHFSLWSCTPDSEGHIKRSRVQREGLVTWNPI